MRPLAGLIPRLSLSLSLSLALLSLALALLALTLALLPLTLLSLTLLPLPLALIARLLPLGPLPRLLAFTALAVALLGRVRQLLQLSPQFLDPRQRGFGGVFPLLLAGATRHRLGTPQLVAEVTQPVCHRTLTTCHKCRATATNVVRCNGKTRLQLRVAQVLRRVFEGRGRRLVGRRKAPCRAGDVALKTVEALAQRRFHVGQPRFLLVAEPALRAIVRPLGEQLAHGLLQLLIHSPLLLIEIAGPRSHAGQRVLQGLLLLPGDFVARLRELPLRFPGGLVQLLAIDAAALAVLHGFAGFIHRADCTLKTLRGLLLTALLAGLALLAWLTALP